MISITCLLIFILKIVENALATLRIIVIANGKKGLGASLNFLMALTWIFSTSLVLGSLNENLWNILSFSFGTFVGSYMGSIIEEKLALGSNMIIGITNKDKEGLSDKIRELSYSVIELEGKDKDDEKNIYIIPTTRKRKRKLIHFMKRMDKKSIIIVDNAYSDTSL